MEANTLEKKLQPKKRRSSKRLLLAKMALLFTSLMLLFVVAEVGLRIVGAKPRTATVLNSYFQSDGNAGWVGRPNVAIRFTTSEFNALTTHDSAGLRQCGISRSDQSLQDDDQQVVWCVGDSVTWGWGVADADTWVSRLNQSGDGQQVFRNLGVPGFSSLQEYLLIQSRFERGEQPEKIMLVYSCNDPQDNLADRDGPFLKIVDEQAVIQNHPAAPASLTRRARGWLKCRSLAVNYLDYYLMRAKEALRSKSQHVVQRAQDSAGNSTAEKGTAEKGTASGKSWSKAEKIAMYHVYTMFRDLCLKQGVELIVVTYDSQPEIDELCQQLAIDRLDVAPYFHEHARSSEKPEPIVYEHDEHWNERGNQIMAAGLLDILQQQQLAERKDSSSQTR